MYIKKHYFLKHLTDFDNCNIVIYIFMDGFSQPKNLRFVFVIGDGSTNTAVKEQQEIWLI